MTGIAATSDVGAWATVAAVAGFALGRGLLAFRLRRPPDRLVRVNVDGRPVPAVLAEPILLSGLLVLGVVVATSAHGRDEASPRMALAVAAVTVVLGVAGRWDDLRGDERPRGFKGHLSAAGRGALTGGIVKMVAGGAAGATAGLLVSGDWAVVEVAALVALTANLVNLLDRAPGRAGKVTIALGAPLAVFGSAAWTLCVAGVMGALCACLGADLAARAMLGDAAANPLGGIVGLGLATSLDRPARLAAIAVLLALNALSEKYSFSRAIERVAVLRTLDRWGRGDPK